jgi:hypothetical protein
VLLLKLLLLSNLASLYHIAASCLDAEWVIKKEVKGSISANKFPLPLQTKHQRLPIKIYSTLAFSQKHFDISLVIVAH